MVKVDETLHIHLGPNGQPLSFEWVRYDYTTMSCPPFEGETRQSCPPSQGGTQGGCREPSSGNKPSSVNGQLATATLLSDTYYYHYDLHGNVIKVTDSSATTKISYEYDVLGEITSTTNPDGISNPFTFRGGVQAIYDEEVELYFGGGYYRADLGTTLSSNEITTSPTTITTTSRMMKTFKSAMQHKRVAESLLAHKEISQEIMDGNELYMIDNDIIDNELSEDDEESLIDEEGYYKEELSVLSSEKTSYTVNTVKPYVITKEQQNRLDRLKRICGCNATQAEITAKAIDYWHKDGLGQYGRSKGHDVSIIGIVCRILAILELSGCSWNLDPAESYDAITSYMGLNFTTKDGHRYNVRIDPNTGEIFVQYMGKTNSNETSDDDGIGTVITLTKQGPDGRLMLIIIGLDDDDDKEPPPVILPIPDPFPGMPPPIQ